MKKPRGVKAAGLFAATSMWQNMQWPVDVLYLWMSASGYCIGRAGLAYTSKRPL